MNGPILLHLKWTPGAIINDFLSISHICVFIGRFQFGNQFMPHNVGHFRKIYHIFEKAYEWTHFIEFEMDPQCHN